MNKPQIPAASVSGILVLLLFALSFQSLARDILFHHFYTSERLASPVYLTGLLSESALTQFQKTLPDFSSKRGQLKGDERLLAIKHPEPDRQDALSRLAGLRLYPSGLLSDYISCDLSSPVDIYFANHSSSTDAYELVTLPGPLNTRCSQFLHPDTGPVYFDQMVAVSESQPEFFAHSDDLLLIEVPPAQKNDNTAGMPGGITTEGLLKLLSGSGSGFSPKFDFRPGGGGLSNLLDIQLMLKWVPVKGNNDNEIRLEDRVVISIVDATGREWQQAYTRDQAVKLLAGVYDGDDMLSRIRDLKLVVSAQRLGDLSSACRESIARLMSVLEARRRLVTDIVAGGKEVVPGVIKAMDSPGKSGTKPSPGGSGKSGISGSGRSETSSASGSLSGGASGGSGDGDGEDEKKPPAKLPAACEVSEPGQQATKTEKYIYIFKHKDQHFELEVLSNDISIASFKCSICLFLCEAASSFCMAHFNCFKCLMELTDSGMNSSKARCPICRGVKSDLTVVPFVDNIIQSLIVCCPGKDDGCTATPEVSNLLSHCETCLYVRDKCPNTECDFSAIRLNLREHRETCRYEVVQCYNQEEGCDAVMKREDILKHQALCQFMVVRCSCPGCPELIHKFEIDTHKGECGYFHIPCDNEECTELCLRKDLDRHKLHECQYRKMVCESCQKEHRYLDLKQHSRLCEQRLVECPLCDRGMTYKDSGRHQRDCFKSAQPEATNFKRLVASNLLSIARESEMSERIKQLEQQLREAVRKKNEWVCRVDRLRVEHELSKQKLESEIKDITEKNEAMAATLDSLRQTIDCPGFQLVRFYSDVYKASGSEALKDFSFCAIPLESFGNHITKFDIEVSGFHLLFIIIVERIVYNEVKFNARFVTEEGKHFIWPVGKTMAVGCLTEQGRIKYLWTHPFTSGDQVFTAKSPGLTGQPEIDLEKIWIKSNQLKLPDFYIDGKLILVLRFD